MVNLIYQMDSSTRTMSVLAQCKVQHYVASISTLDVDRVWVEAQDKWVAHIELLS